MVPNVANRFAVRNVVSGLVVVFNCAMTIGDRHRRILDAVQQAGQLGVTQLAELTGTSEMTVRRDLEQLADQGMLERYRGGARSLTLRGEEPPFTVRMHESREAKRRIAEAVADLIADGEAVVLDSGTTCLRLPACSPRDGSRSCRCRCTRPTP